MCYIIKSKTGEVYVTSQDRQLNKSAALYLRHHSISRFFIRKPGESRNCAIAMSI